MGRGGLLVERYGHGAICVRFQENLRRSGCYNFGRFDFSDPFSLAIGLLRGDSNFWVERESFTKTIHYYRQRKRSIWVQKLTSLSSKEKKWIARYLEKNASPKYRDYRYHHFFNNCTTQIRDILYWATGKFVDSKPVADVSFRDLGREGLMYQPVILIATDFLVGRSADSSVNGWHSMFLPVNLRKEIESHFGAKPVLLYEGLNFEPRSSETGRLWVILFGLLLALPLGFAFLRKRRIGTFWLAILSLVLGVIGLLLWIVACYSSLPELRYNEALLLFVPTDLFLVLLSGRRLVQYARLRIVVIALVSFFVAVGIFLQPLWAPMMLVFLPMILLAFPPAEKNS